MDKNVNRENVGMPTFWLVLAVFFLVMAGGFALVALAGTDIPILDQWDSEGLNILPKFASGVLTVEDILRPHNEHHIVPTNLLNLALFSANGGWDPYVEISVGVILRALVAGMIALFMFKAPGSNRIHWILFTAAIALFLPGLDWHNVLWGFQTQVWFSLIFSILSIHAFSLGKRRALVGAGLAACAACLSMGSGYLVPVVFSGLVMAQRQTGRGTIRRAQLVLIGGVLLLAGFLRYRSGSVQTCSSQNLIEATFCFLRVLSWPHSDMPAAALVMQCPMLVAVVVRMRRRRSLVVGESKVVALWLFCTLLAAAMAFSRGGGDEMRAGGVPSRYVDFVIPLVLTNIWAWFSLGSTQSLSPRWRPRLFLGVWLAFLVVGWASLVVETWRHIIIPRISDREAPVRYALDYQRTRNPDVFAGQPRFYVPHPDLKNVAQVLDDPRLVGRLPPSFQPELPLGTLSRWCRFAQRNWIIVTGFMLAAAIMCIWRHVVLGKGYGAKEPIVVDQV